MSLRTEILDRCLLHGQFELSSKVISDTYFDKYLFESDPNLLISVASELQTFISSDTQILAGMELGGIPIVTALSIITGLPMTFVRKAPKSYGTKKMVEGADVSGKKVTAIEDVVTSAKNLIAGIDALRLSGAYVESAIAVLERNPLGRENLAKINIRLHSLINIQL